MKKIIILKHGGGELANQLWNFLSIYAYGLEVKAPVRNPSFFEYHLSFKFLRDERLATKCLSIFFRTPRRRSHPINKIARLAYLASAKVVEKINSGCIFSSENNQNEAVYLPPTKALPANFESSTKIYFTGWLFRNPSGLDKFRAELVKAFAPNEKVADKVQEILTPLRQKFNRLVGIHIRQADYGEFKSGKYLIDQKRVREIINEYAKNHNLDILKTVFIITSDGRIDENHFAGLNIYISKENAVTDLFLLSKTF